MDAIAKQLNRVIEAGNSHLLEMMSSVGKQLFFPKGILTQSAEAKEKAHLFNATAGIAKEKGKTMRLDSVMRLIGQLQPRESLTYAPSFGLPELRQLWQQKLYEKNPSLQGKSVSLPIVSCGITHGISVFADMWVDAGDVIVLPEPMWGNYNMIFSVRKGAAISRYPIFTDKGTYNLAAFEEQINATARDHDKIVVLLNFPHNPSGYSVTRQEAEAVVQILTDLAASGKNILAVTDDSYFGLFYEENIFKESLFSLLCGIHPRILAVKLDGCTKENFVWGLRVGFITYGVWTQDNPVGVNDALEKKTAGCVRGTISNASHLSQSIVWKSMLDEHFEAEKAAKFEILQRRAQRVREVLKNEKYQDAWDVYPFNSGYFMCLKLKTVNAEALRRHLLDQYGVGLISIGDRNLRVAFSCVEADDVAELFEIIFKGIKELEG
jgi:aspartate/methionine/tyrosine aminotransferase